MHGILDIPKIRESNVFILAKDILSLYQVSGYTFSFIPNFAREKSMQGVLTILCMHVLFLGSRGFS